MTAVVMDFDMSFLSSTMEWLQQRWYQEVFRDTYDKVLVRCLLQRQYLGRQETLQEIPLLPITLSRLFLTF